MKEPAHPVRPGAPSTGSCRAYWIGATLLMGILLGAPVAQAFDDVLLRAVPRDALAVIEMDRPHPAESSLGVQVGLLATQAIEDVAGRLGLLADYQETIRSWTDGIAAGALALRYPVVFTVLDVRTVGRGDGGSRLMRMDAALLIRTDGRNDQTKKRIRHLLATYTNSDETTVRRVTHGRYTFYELVDKRVPAWARVSWGAMDGVYVVALGDRAIDRLVAVADGKTPPLATGPWFRGAQDQCRLVGGRTVFYINLDRLHSDQPHQFTDKLDEVLTVLHLPDAERIYGVIGQSGRVAECRLYLHQWGRDRLVRVADHAFLREWGYDIVPPRATTLAAVDARFSALPLEVWDAYLRSRSPSTRRMLEQGLAEIEQQAGVRVREDLFAHLGDRIIIHDYPLHALRLPIARTIYIPINTEPDRVATRLDAFLQVLAQRISGSSGMTALKRAPDGVWFIDVGLQGPAIKASGRWIVISYSPWALRENLKHLANRPARVPHP